MTKHSFFHPLSFLFALGVWIAPDSRAVDFTEEIRPILNKKCFKCHTGPKAKGGLRMDSEEDFGKRIGGDDPLIIPGDPAKSTLSIKAGLPRTDGDAMPPPPARERGAEAMTPGELALVRQWIAEGAKFSADASAPEPAPATPAPAPAAMKEGELLTWSNSTGNSLQAGFVSMSDTHVTLRKEDGTQFEYPLANLSPESQALAKKLAGK